jgi:hypothetical protein
VDRVACERSGAEVTTVDMRTRLLRPGFFENEDLAALPPHARLLFAGLWLMADRAGRLKDRPPVIRATIFPFEPSVDVDLLLGVLHRGGFVLRYRGAKRVKCVQVVNFALHQYPHKREPLTTLPAPRKSPGRARKNPGRAEEKPGPSPVDTNTDTNTDKPASPPVFVPPFRVYAAIAGHVLREAPSADLSTLAETFKTACARQGLPYSGDLTRKAIDAARVAQARRRA